MYQGTRKERKKAFQDAKSQRGILLQTRNNRRRRKKKKKGNAKIYFKRTYPHLLSAPKYLSIFENSEGTLKYFSEVIETISRCTLDDSIFFDLSEVEIVTPDAIMYLIALLRNVRRIRALRIKCSGNTPKNESAREIINQSGFFAFVSSNVSRKIDTDNRYMKISTGKDADGVRASSFCDFVHRSCQANTKNTKHLYTMIIELMTNTYQHAYEPSEKQIMIGNWYIFAQDIGAAIHFVFLDTGVGIPKTVVKRFHEKIKDLVSKNDAFYLESTLRGDFRTETKQLHRGKGLPDIYKDACNKSIEHLSIVSGKGKCLVKDDGSITTESLLEAFEGTLFAWDILKEGVLT